MRSESDDDDFEDDDDEEEPSRARELLASFYGKLAENGDEAAPTSGKAIDRSEFEADEYVRDMLETKPLSELLSEDEGLCRDIKSLSGEMQMLVYENYSKFIAATDTIRDMQQNVSAMEDEMKALTVTMAEIDTMSGSVNASLADKRAQIDKLVRARRLLKRLEFLFELPRKLNSCVAAKKYDEAVKYYTTTDEILQRYAHVPSLREIHREASRIASSLRESLRASLDAEPSEVVPAVLAERVDLLVRLGADAKECERTVFESGLAHLRWALRTSLAKPCDGSIARKVASIASDVAPRFVAVADALEAVSRGRGPMLDDLAMSVFSEYIQAVEQLVVDDDDVAAAQALEIAGDLVETAAARCNVGDYLRDKLSLLGRRVASKRLEASIRSARHDALGRLAGLATIEAKDIRDVCLEKAKGVARAAAAALEKIAPLSRFLDEENIVFEAAADFFEWFAGAAEAFGLVRSLPPVESDDKTDQARVVDPPESFPEMCERWKVEAPFPDASNPTRPLAAAALASAVKQACADDDADRKKRLVLLSDAVSESRMDRAASALVARFAKLQSALITRARPLVDDKVPDHDDDDGEQKRPRPALVAALETLDSAVDVFAKAVGDDGPRPELPAPSFASRQPPRPPAPRVGGIQLDVERLFTKQTSKTLDRADTYGAWTPDALAAFLLRALARAMVEAVRVATLDKPAYDQLELDARFLHAALEPRVHNSDELRDLERLVSEFLQSAADRSKAPVLNGTMAEQIAAQLQEHEDASAS